MAEGSKRVVYVALGGNLAIALIKFAAFLFTRSSAMLTEAVHSLVDILDQIFLLVGIHRAARPADEDHPFGHGLEAYFWSFAVALLIFALGGAASIYQGVQRILHPEALSRPWINYLVLALSAVFEATSFVVSYREFRRTVHGRRIRLWRFLHLSKDPSLFATLLEDAAALVGLAIAAVGVTGAAVFHWAWADGAASVAIGLLLAAVSLFLANEVRSLITGEAAAPRVVAAVRVILDEDPDVAVVDEVLSLHLGPESILIGVTLEFRDGLSGDEIQAAAQALSDRVQASDSRIGRIFLRPMQHRPK
ncbi:MAG: cation diffusion facilitator family transporter [Caulobacteraceae bacterium]|nr:cation diffusion facilitator family transporter [Caulobacteraceae bacterium]